MAAPELLRFEEIDKPRDHCAVVGVISFSGRDVAPDVRFSLYGQQNRGEDGSGIAVHDSYSGSFNYYKEAGLVVHVFPSGKLKELGLSGPVAVGSTRYATSGSKENELEDKSSCLMPYVVGYNRRSLALVHNGNIPTEQLLPLIEELPNGVPMQSNTDSEVIAWRILHSKGDNWREKISNGLSGVVGAYSFVIATDEGDLFGIKDPRGIRPLVLAETNDGAALVSETAGLQYLRGVKRRREIRNGEMVQIKKNGEIRVDRIFPEVSTARCVVEPIYFKQPFSMEGDFEVREVRERMGAELAKEFQPPNDAVIIGIPESGLEIAKGYVNALGRSTTNLIKKNRYKPEPNSKERTFISDSDEERDRALELKFIISEAVFGKKLYLVDDSVIRGNTTRKLINALRGIGASEVHILSGAPPFVNTCDLGVDIAKLQELVALDLQYGELDIKPMEKIAREIGADSIHYLSIDGLSRAIGGSPSEFCMGCLNGSNPIEHSGGFHEYLYSSYLPDKNS